MTTLRHWFEGRSKREQRLLLVMLALLVLTIVWGLIIRPVGDALSGARQRHAAAVIRLGLTAAQVEAVRGATRRVPAPLPGPLTDVIRASATQAGFNPTTVDPDGSDGVSLAIPSARGTALVTWLARLEREGIVVVGATLTDNGDRTVAARLRLRSRGS